MRISDWSSDVCSSDLGAAEVRGRVRRDENLHDLVTPSCLSEPVEPGGVIDEDLAEDACIGDPSVHQVQGLAVIDRVERLQLFHEAVNVMPHARVWPVGRSEERRVGKGGYGTCRSLW